MPDTATAIATPAETNADIEADLALHYDFECTCEGGASWYSLHGTCTCGPYEERPLGPLTWIIGNIWDRPRLHSQTCPLHGWDNPEPDPAWEPVPHVDGQLELIATSALTALLPERTVIVHVRL